MMTVIEDKVTAVDLTKVVMIHSSNKIENGNVLTSSDLSYQEERRKRKVRRLNFEVR